VNVWLWAATILTAALIPLAVVAARTPRTGGLVAMTAAGTDTVFVLLLLAEGVHSQSFADLALVLAVMTFIGSVAFIRFLERLR
jgi:multisubunit Na+/H+ antiporter MnhF subunit